MVEDPAVVLDLIRYTVFAAVLASAGIAVGSWALRTRRLNPFGRSARLVRRVSEPVLDPIESLLLRRGGNPSNAEWWLVGIALVGGLLVVTAANWIAAIAIQASGAAAAGPRGILRLVIYWASQVVVLALFARVIGSWFGVGRVNRWMRPAYTLTDWIVEPLRRVIPPIAMFDFTPIVAWILILVLRGIVLGIV
jgi:YggT family protein